MKYFSVLIFSAVVAMTIEKCRNIYLLVKFNGSEEKGTFKHIVTQIVSIQNLQVFCNENWLIYLTANGNKPTRSTELLKKLRINKDAKRKSGDTRGSVNYII